MYPVPSYEVPEQELEVSYTQLYIESRHVLGYSTILQVCKIEMMCECVHRRWRNYFVSCFTQQIYTKM